MTDTPRDRVGLSKHLNESSQHPVLNLFKRSVVTALELDSDREVITMVTPMPLRLTGMPGSRLAWHELHEFAVATNQEV
jgi:hypothetical protein